MRMNSVPRSVAEPLGAEFSRQSEGTVGNQNVGMAREFLRTLSDNDWSRIAPHGAAMSGRDYMQIWSVLSGEQKV